MRAADLDVNASSHDGPTAYARAKRGLVILTQWWAKELAAAGIGVDAMHPGWVDTPGLRNSAGIPSAAGNLAAHAGTGR